MHASLDKANNSKDSKTKELKLANFSQSIKTSNKVWKEKKKQWRREKRDEKDFNAGNSVTPASGVNTTNNSGGKKCVQQDLCYVTTWNCDKKKPIFQQLPGASEPKKLVTVMATSALVTEASTENISLQRVPCIQYPVQFQKS